MKAVVTCALTGVLTNPQQHPVPVTVEEMAASAKEACDAGASILHVHFRNQEPGMGFLPSWDPEVAGAICDAIREACPGVILNMSTGVMDDDISGPLACMERVKPRFRPATPARSIPQGASVWKWGWPPMVFSSSRGGAVPRCHAPTRLQARVRGFDTGIVARWRCFVRPGCPRRPPTRGELRDGGGFGDAGRSAIAATAPRVDSR